MALQYFATRLINLLQYFATRLINLLQYFATRSINLGICSGSTFAQSLWLTPSRQTMRKHETQSYWPTSCPCGIRSQSRRQPQPFYEETVPLHDLEKLTQGVLSCLRLLCSPGPYSGVSLPHRASGITLYGDF